MRYRLIMNPASRSGKGRNVWRYWKDRLDRAEVNYEAVVSESIEHCTALAYDADEFDVIVAVGGDGTINAVINGVMENPRKDVKFGVLYAGTSPDFCRFNKIPCCPEKSMDALLSNCGRTIDVLNIEYIGLDGELRQDYFACSANMGLGKDTADGANRIRKYFGDKLGTGLALIKAIIKSKRYDFKVKLNNDNVDIRAVNHLTVIKNPYIASGLKLDFDLSPDDGCLGVWAMHGLSGLGIIRMMPHLYKGKNIDREGVMSWHGLDALEIIEPAGLAVEFDGDHHGYLPARIKVARQQLNLIGADYEK